MDTKDALTVGQAAKLIGISANGVIAAIYRGTLKAEKIGTIYLICRQEATRYKAQNSGHVGRTPGRKTTRAHGSRADA